MNWQNIIEKNEALSNDKPIDSRNTKLKNTLSKRKLPSGKHNVYSFSQDVFPVIDLSYIPLLLKDNIIEEKETPYLFHIDKKPNSDGVTNVAWLLPLENKKVTLNVEVLKAFLMVFKVNFYIKVRGFYSTIQLI